MGSDCKCMQLRAGARSGYCSAQPHSCLGRLPSGCSQQPRYALHGAETRTSAAQKPCLTATLDCSTGCCDKRDTLCKCMSHSRPGQFPSVCSRPAGGNFACLLRSEPSAGTCYVWRMMRGATLTTHFEPLHKLRAHPGAPVWGVFSLCCTKTFFDCLTVKNTSKDAF